MGLLLLLLSCGAEPATAPGPEPALRPAPRRSPDVLLVVLDTVRADAVGAYGNPREVTPHLDRLASRGVVFEDVTVSGTWSWPSHASLFTGEYPWVHGAHFAVGGEGYTAENGSTQLTALREDLPTLAERFAEAGYRTVNITGNPWLKQGLGLDRGFDTTYYEEQGERVLDRMEKVVAEQNPRPLFLFVNLFDVHAPFELRAAPWLQDRADLTRETAPAWIQPYLTADGRKLNLYRGEDGTNGMVAFSRGELSIPDEGLALLRDVYEGEVWHIDMLLGRALKSWRGRPQGRVVAVTSDHGEYLGERRRLDHGRSVYPEVSAVPLVIAKEGLPSARISTPVQLEGVPDTLLSLAGLRHGDRSLLELPDLDVAAPVTILAASWPDLLWAREIGPPHHLGERLYRVGQEAVVIRGDAATYYRLDVDPGMTMDVSAAHPDRAAALTAAAASAFPEAAAQGLELSEADAEALRALGYLE